jgi:hypothetical protein
MYIFNRTNSYFGGKKVVFFSWNRQRYVLVNYWDSITGYLSIDVSEGYGAACGKWWEGPYNGLEEGFTIIHIKGDEFDWEYFDYGWEVQQ